MHSVTNDSDNVFNVTLSNIQTDIQHFLHVHMQLNSSHAG